MDKKPPNDHERSAANTIELIEDPEDEKCMYRGYISTRGLKLKAVVVDPDVPES